jgi:hypothetical protein
MKQIEGYYGEYDGKLKVRDYVESYIASDIDADKLHTLLRYITYSHPVNFGPPDIAAIEKAISSAISVRDGGSPKGADVHSVRSTDGSKYRASLTDEEAEEGARMLKAAGGLMGFIKVPEDTVVWKKKQEES